MAQVTIVTLYPLHTLVLAHLKSWILYTTVPNYILTVTVLHTVHVFVCQTYSCLYYITGWSTSEKTDFIPAAETVRCVFQQRLSNSRLYSYTK